VHRANLFVLVLRYGGLVLRERQVVVYWMYCVQCDRAAVLVGLEVTCRWRGRKTLRSDWKACLDV